MIPRSMVTLLLAAAVLTPLAVELGEQPEPVPEVARAAEPMPAAAPAVPAVHVTALPAPEPAAAPAGRLDEPPAAGPAPLLFTRVEHDAPAPADRSVLRERTVRAALDLAGAETVDWNLFDDTVLRVEDGRTTLLADDGSKLSWRGRVAGDPFSEVIALVKHGRLTASIALSDGSLFTVDTMGDGTQRVREIQQSVLPDCGSDLHDLALAAPAEDAGAGGAPQLAGTAAAGGPETIDVLLLYTAGAVNVLGSTTATEDRLELQILWANAIYENTGATQRLRAAGVVEVSYDDSHGDGRTSLDDLTNAGDGQLESVPELRDAYGADMVTLFTRPSNVCGIAWVASSAAYLSWYEDYMFSVVNMACTGSGKTFAHELGHNQGAYHDPATSLLQGMTQQQIDGVPYPNSFGYIGVGDVFHTTMAYASTCSGCTFVQQFSTPLLSYAGQPTGDARSDVLVTLEQTYDTVAGFRSPVECTGQNDSDGDGVCDALDNCTNVANVLQVDTDVDGFGNACDGDYTNDGVVGIQDYSLFLSAYGSHEGDPGYDGSFDHDEDGGVGATDYLRVMKFYGGSPGPSGLACAGTSPCAP